MIRLVLLFLLGGLSSFADEYSFNEETDALVSRLDIEQWYSDIEHLSSYNRHYQNEGNNEARRWLKLQFENMGIKAHDEEFLINQTKAYNVIAEIPGRSNPEEIYIIGAHYDSISEQPNILAPGAEDNASGTAGLLALARSIKEPPRATIRFVAFSGEEAGLFGSKHYVQTLSRQGEEDKVKGVLIMDMIGFSEDDDLDILLETSAENQPLVDLSLASLAKYCTARAETTFNYWGSDHVPFIRKNYPTVLYIENDYGNYPDYHRSTDTIANISKAMGEQILRMMAGVMGYWLN